LVDHGSLFAAFRRGLKGREESYIPALSRFADKLRSLGENRTGFLIPDPKKGSALKRLNLFMRWMIRDDRVDPGLWAALSAAKLVVPLDTHLHRNGLSLGFTKRRQSDIRTATEITAGFRELNKRDPVKYDFTIAHLGMSHRKGLIDMLHEGIECAN
jgi:uncharacterized protein (TIGR02757 family)